jgi:hypothetical protein
VGLIPSADICEIPCIAGECFDFVLAVGHVLECETHIAGSVDLRYYLFHVSDQLHAAASCVFIPLQLCGKSIEY